MSALAMFSLKYPSLLQFDQDLNEKCLRHNLKTLYGVEKAPCDTRMRERLDGLSLRSPRLAMKSILARLQRGKVLEAWKFMDQYYLVSLDGTGFFSSSQVHCSHCCEKHHRNGTITYSHQMVVGSIVHPDVRQVLPIGFEPIHKNDGAKKNDCERNASKRWLEEFRHQHPQLPTVIIADGLSANGPFLDLLEQHRCHYILVCQEDDHTYLWDWFWKAEQPDFTEIQETVGGIQKTYRFMKDVPLNDSRSDKRVTVDEVFLNLPALSHKEYHDFGSYFVQKVLKHVWIPVTVVGIIPTKTLTKVANRAPKKQKKPSGVLLTVCETYGALKLTEIGDVWGIGRNLTTKLKQLGIYTAYDLARKDPRWARKVMTVTGERLVRELQSLCYPIEPDRHSIHVTCSFGRKLRELEDIAQAVSSRNTSW